MGQDIAFNEKFEEVSVNSFAAGQGYLSIPKGKDSNDKFPAVIVLQEWWGLAGHIKEVVDRFAAAGFLSFAPDLYHGQLTREPDTARKLMMELQLDEAAKEIEFASKMLINHPKYDANKFESKVSVIGFCMGGSLAIWSASKVALINKAIAFYPGASWERHNPNWENFSGKSAQIHCAESDGTSAAPGIQEAVTHIRNSGGVVDTYDYPGSQHAFFNNDRPEVYDAAAAVLSWQRSLDFLHN